MRAATPEPGPEEGQPDLGDQQAGNDPGPTGFTWVPGREEDGLKRSGPVPSEALPSQKPAGAGPARLDWQALLDALAASGMLDGDYEDQDAELADELAAEADGRMGPAMDPPQLAAIAVEHMEPGPALAGWLDVAAGAAPSLDENGLTGLAVAARKQAAHAHAVELAAVAQITARAAAADRRIGVDRDGRPARVSRDAAGQIEMALMLSHDSAEAWADLALALAWRLPRTGAALVAGWIDLDRAKIIAQATSVLSGEAARTVEAKVLPEARWRTTAQLRAWLHLLVIAADPEGAEERRQKAERNANVRLYADDDQTATMVADKLPQIEGAAGFARINAMARARKAAGQPGSLGLHRAQVLLGLILGTLPPTPPAEEAPPDQPWPPGDEPGSRDDGPGPADGGRPGDPGDEPGRPGVDGPWDEPPPPPDEPAPGDEPGATGDSTGGPNDIDPDRTLDPWEADDDTDGTGPAPTWPALGPLPPALTRPAPADGTPPAAGLLDVTLPWVTLAGLAERPGTLGRIGAITPAQARRLALAAADDPSAQWRVIVTNSAGQAIAVTRIRRRSGRARASRTCDGPRRLDGPLTGPGPAGRITLTISQDTVTTLRQPGRTRPPPGTGPPSTGPPSTGPPVRIVAAALRTAIRSLRHAPAQAEADAAAGGCAHTTASAAYRPPPRLREYVIARDRTCRNPVCGQPAWRGDLDHTIPWDDGGRTCRCNCGGACRRDHQLKQHPRWKLRQVSPGWFEWTAPSGRTYAASPATYIA